MIAAMTLRQTTAGDAELMHAYYRTNAAHLRPWEPRQPAHYHSLETWRLRVVSRLREQRVGAAAYFVAVDDATGGVAAVCNLSPIMRGAFQACYMGFSAAERWQGQGVMKKLCDHVIEHAFGTLRLHRIMANHLPHNTRSEALLGRLGFQQEGYAKSYLQIDGRWQDHVMTALINPSREQA